jgi:hypothetical protein
LAYADTSYRSSPAAPGHLGDAIEHGVGHVVVGQAAAGTWRTGVRLHRQVVDRQVRRQHRQRLRQVALEAGEVLAGQRVHQVEVERVEGQRRFFQRGDGLRPVMHAAQGLQVRVVEALDTERQARDAGIAVGAEAVALEGAGIGLERDLAAGLQLQPRAQVAHQPFDGGGREQAGRAAADEHAVHGAAPHQRQRGIQVGQQRVEVAVERRLARCHLVRVEVAVRALAQAPRQVHVDRQRRQRRQLQQPGAHVVRQVAHDRGAPARP